MNDDKYFWLTVTEDGDVYLDALSKSELLNQMDEYSLEVFGGEIPDTNVLYWGSQGRPSTIVIKGKIVIPKVIQVATEYDIE